ncbi:hypothetical protein DCS_06082 [Drechmeria coniospora]|uniref:Uncharacterized protein n=1 Tax=Drechmeria coniospora TaxID=98403 RepID=A0A151GAM1_DRECN|nr:hypothetical protein DCS_06082 [Drechmeria coniospora]KYK54125.1 hypothetical protein DCS_06082 [Drechmeria coniospora]
MEEQGPSLAKQVDLSRNLEAEYALQRKFCVIPCLTSARIRNLLEDVAREQLMRDVETFAEYRCLQEHVDVLKKGAVVAQRAAAIYLALYRPCLTVPSMPTFSLKASPCCADVTYPHVDDVLALAICCIVCIA